MPKTSLRDLESLCIAVSYRAKEKTKVQNNLVTNLFAPYGFCRAFPKGCISARLAVKQISKASPVLSRLHSLILASELVYGNNPNLWQRMITLEYAGNFSLSPIHKNPSWHFPDFGTPCLPSFPISIHFSFLTYI